MSAALMVAVVVLSKQAPERVAIEGCGRVRSLRATEQGVEICEERCRVEERAELRCRHALRVGDRTYGKTLRATVENGKRSAQRAERAERGARALPERDPKYALRLISDIELEPYVAGVVASEMAGAPDEAKRALAIVARSYALEAKAHPRHPDADLCDLTHCQVLRSAADDPVLASTAGRTLPPPVFFHSTCGGRTHDAHRVWPELTATDRIGVSDVDPSGEPYCKSSPHFRWISEIGERELASIVEMDPSSLEIRSGFELRDDHRSKSIAPHQLHLMIGRKLGWNAAKSPFFEAERTGRAFRLRGHGLGHGVGLCQYGAIERARRGASADEILRAYFPKLFEAEISPPSIEIDAPEDQRDRWRAACEAVARELPGSPGTWRITIRQADDVGEFVSRTGRSRFEAAAFAGDTVWLSPLIARFGDLDPIRRHECVHARLRHLGVPPLPRVIEEAIAIGIAGQSARMPPVRPFEKRELAEAERALSHPVDRSKLELSLARAHATVWPRWRERSPGDRLSFLREIVLAGSAWVDLL